MFEEKNIVLASLSPRRKQLLEQAEVKFVIKTWPVKEDYPPDILPAEVPVYLAEKKARVVQKQCSAEELIIAADTIVLLGEQVLDKPKDKNKASEILTSLSGKRHMVITGVCLLKGEEVKTFSETTQVYFRKLSKEQIVHYVEQYNPMDKAGAYAIQEWIGLIGIKKIEGDYFNVVGLPVGRVVEEIGKF
jgi:septum formation protein